MAYCSNCGNRLTEGAKFCPNCGHSVKKKITANESMEQPKIVYNKTYTYMREKVKVWQ